MSCDSCGTTVEANFSERPLARLPVEHQRFIEIFVLAGGSLKEIAQQAEVSYPTVRNRLDKVIDQLQKLMDEEHAANEPKSVKKKQSSKRRVEQTPSEILKRI